MSNSIQLSRLQLRNDTKENWELVNPVLLNGEIGFEHAVGDELGKIKIGNGVSTWNQLQYFTSGSTVSGDYILDVETEPGGAGESITNPYIAGTHGEARLILRDSIGDKGSYYIRLPDADENLFTDDQVYQIDTSLKAEPSYVFINPKSEFNRASTRYLTLGETGENLGEEDANSPSVYEGYAMNSMLHYMFEAYPSNGIDGGCAWVPVGFNALLLQRGTTDYDGYFGNEAEPNSGGKLVRYTLNEREYKAGVEREFFLDAALTSPSSPYIAGAHGENKINLFNSARDGDGQLIQRYAFIKLPDQADINGFYWDAKLETDFYMVIDSGDDSELGFCLGAVVMSDNFSQTSWGVQDALNSQDYPLESRDIRNNTALRNIYGSEMDLITTTNACIIAKGCHVKYDFYKNMYGGISWCNSGHFGVLFNRTDNGDGWGNGIEADSNGYLKRFTLSESQYKSVEKVYYLDPLSSGLGFTQEEIDNLPAYTIEDFDTNRNSITTWVRIIDTEDPPNTQYLKNPRSDIGCGLSQALQPTYIAGTHGENRIICRPPTGENISNQYKSFVRLDVTDSELTRSLDLDHVMFIDSSNANRLIVLCDNFNNIAPTIYNTGDSKSKYVCMGGRQHFGFEFYFEKDIDGNRYSLSWVPAKDFALLLQEGDREDGAWGNDVEPNSSGRLQRYTLSEAQYNAVDNGITGEYVIGDKTLTITNGIITGIV